MTPWTLKVIPWQQRAETISDHDIKDGTNHSAIHKKEDLASLDRDGRKRFMDAKRQRKKRQTLANKLQQLTE